ncbi:hypothetical protein [Haloarchaeobius sp. DFWS5]|uniref:hypothetical protein n=1 Tax=Haloarchaeobius sp. DFWS5 TaxID=3446114 RepID=UPI003EBE62BC
MSLTELFDSPRVKQVSTLSMLTEGAVALWKGKTTLAALCFGGAVLSYRWSPLGFAAEAAIQLYRRQRTTAS